MKLSQPKPISAGVSVRRNEYSYTFYDETHFRRLLGIERRRTERSKKPFLLMLLDISSLMAEEYNKEIIFKLESSLSSILRETDIRGWYDESGVIGVVFTEMASLEAPAIEEIFRKIHRLLNDKLPEILFKKIAISFHIYPEVQGSESVNGLFNIKPYPDLAERRMGNKLTMTVKRLIDVAGSFIALLLFSPVFLAIATAIKLTSEGPVFFKQERLGLNGKTFKLYKFRSMYTNNDPSKHKDYIRKFISEQNNAAVEPGVFKLKNDLRITPVGKFLRKASLDELPQLINVLKGEMSLVGPRPPIPYECDIYDIWHRRRLLSCKPGITGLWQVTGRSRTTFDEMVRLDLEYINKWSLWLDLKIILKTPKAVFGGDGAF
jgi:lipopolysaccharide/colanic/teichoic acid biosynthesis glycosyltransferase